MRSLSFVLVIGQITLGLATNVGRVDWLNTGEAAESCFGDVGFWLKARFIGSAADAMWFVPSETNGSLWPWEPLPSLHCSGLS